MTISRRKIVFELTLMLVSLALLGGACRTPKSGGPSRPFKVAFNTWVGYSPLLIAKEKGFLKEEGIDADISFLEGVGKRTGFDPW